MLENLGFRSIECTSSSGNWSVYTETLDGAQIITYGIAKTNVHDTDSSDSDSSAYPVVHVVATCGVRVNIENKIWERCVPVQRVSKIPTQTLVWRGVQLRNMHISTRA